MVKLGRRRRQEEKKKKKKKKCNNKSKEKQKRNKSIFKSKVRRRDTFLILFSLHSQSILMTRSSQFPEKREEEKKTGIFSSLSLSLRTKKRNLSYNKKKVPVFSSSLSFFSRLETRDSIHHCACQITDNNFFPFHVHLWLHC